MKLSCKRIDFAYTPGEEIFTFPEESGLPFLFDVEEELTADPAAMDAVGKMLDEAEELAEKAKAAIQGALADEGNPYHGTVTYFMRFHRDEVPLTSRRSFFRGTTRSSCLSWSTSRSTHPGRCWSTGTSWWAVSPLRTPACAPRTAGTSPGRMCRSGWRRPAPPGTARRSSPSPAFSPALYCCPGGVGQGAVHPGHAGKVGHPRGGIRRRRGEGR